MGLKLASFSIGSGISADAQALVEATPALRTALSEEERAVLDRLPA